MTKIIRLLISFMVMSFVSGKNEMIRSMDLINISSAIKWSDTLFKKDGTLPNMSEERNSIAIPNIDNVIRDLIDISNEYNAYLKFMNEKQEKRLTYKHITTKFIVPDISEINDHINTVERYYIDIQTFDIGKRLMKETLTQLTNNILWGTNSLPNTLHKIYQIIFPSIQYAKPGLMREIIEDSVTNLQYDCDRYTSTQQYMFFIYVNLIITEMKGLATLTHVYLLLNNLDRFSDYTMELRIAKEKFQTRVINYNEYIKAIMFSSPRVIHRCEIDPPQRGVNFFEFIKYNRILLINSATLGMTSEQTQWYCSSDCAGINHSYLEKLSNAKISDCQTISQSIFTKVCSAKSNSTRKYLWWRTRESIYGHYEPCPGNLEDGTGDPPFMPTCPICACSVIEMSPIKTDRIMNISVTAQVSNIKNNMIVVGVRFVVHDNAIHLQIQQSKLLPGKINGIDNSTVWKALDDYQSTSEKQMSYRALSDYSGGLLLDDVMLPPKYAVTGVQFNARGIAPTGFYLEVQGTPYDWKTGELDVEGSAWFIAGDFDFSNVTDYKHDRIRIKTDGLDDPVRCNEYNYDPATNKLIQFHHSSMKKDAGQSTVPYIDAQPVETYPAFPLSGIGLFYRKKTGCGGYIAPRIFTIDISQYK